MEFVLIILTFMFGVAGIALSRNTYLAIISCRWEAVQATITGTSSKETSDSEFYSKFIPEIRYAYHINGKDFHGKRYEFSNRYYTKSELNSILNNFPTGEKKCIRVNPRNPRQSVIVTGAGLTDFIILAGCLFLFFTSLNSVL